MTFHPISYHRRQRGYIAKKRGQAFEDHVELQAHRFGLKYIRIPDGCEQLGPKTLRRVRTPYDHHIGDPVLKMVACVDTKNLDTITLGRSVLVQHQIENLKMMKECGQIAGYLVHHRPLARVFFYDVDPLFALLWSMRAGSLKPEEVGLDLGLSNDYDLKKLFKRYYEAAHPKPQETVNQSAGDVS